MAELNLAEFHFGNISIYRLFDKCRATVQTIHISIYYTDSDNFLVVEEQRTNDDPVSIFKRPSDLRTKPNMKPRPSIATSFDPFDDIDDDSVLKSEDDDDSAPCVHRTDGILS